MTSHFPAFLKSGNHLRSEIYPRILADTRLADCEVRGAQRRVVGAEERAEGGAAAVGRGDGGAADAEDLDTVDQITVIRGYGMASQTASERSGRETTADVAKRKQKRSARGGLVGQWKGGCGGRLGSAPSLGPAAALPQGEVHEIAHHPDRLRSDASIQSAAETRRNARTDPLSSVQLYISPAQSL